MDEPLYHRATRAAVTAVAKKAGFKHAEQRATQQLASMAQAFMRQLAVYALSNANAEGRANANADDVDAALEDLNLSTEKLHWFLLEVRRTKDGKEALRNFPQPNELIFMKMPHKPAHAGPATPASASVCSNTLPPVQTCPPPSHLPPIPGPPETPTQDTAAAAAAADTDAHMDTAADGGEAKPRSTLASSSSFSATAAAMAGAEQKEGHALPKRAGEEQQNEQQNEQQDVEERVASAATAKESTGGEKKGEEEEDDDITGFLDSLREDEGVTVEGAVSLPPVIEDDPTYDAPAAFIPVTLTPPHTPRRDKKKQANAKERPAPGKARKAERRGSAVVATPDRRTPPTPGKAHAAGKAARDKGRTTPTATAASAATTPAGTHKTPSLKLKVPRRPSKDKATGGKRIPAGRQPGAATEGADHPAKRAKTPSPQRRRTAAKSPTKSPVKAEAAKPTPPTGTCGVALPPSTAPSTAAAVAPKANAAGEKATLRPVVREEAAIPTSARAAAAPAAGKRAGKAQAAAAVAKAEPTTLAAVVAGKKKEKAALQTPVKVKVKLPMKQEPGVERGGTGAGGAVGEQQARVQGKAAKPTARPAPSAAAKSATAALPTAAPSPAKTAKPTAAKTPAAAAAAAASTSTVTKVAKADKAAVTAASATRAPGAVQGGTKSAAKSRASRSSAASSKTKAAASAAKPLEARPRGAPASSREPDVPAKLKDMSQKEIVHRAASLRNTREEQEKASEVSSLYCTSACKLGHAARARDDLPYIACDFCDIWYHMKCVDIGEYFTHMPSFICETCAKRLPPNYKWLQWVLDRLKSYKFETEGGPRPTGNRVFGYPVETEFPDYRKYIKEPMDLGTMQKKLDSGAYKRYSQFFRDVALISINCRNFNPNNKFYMGCADALGIMFESMVEVSLDWLKQQRKK